MLGKKRREGKEGSEFDYFISLLVLPFVFPKEHEIALGTASLEQFQSRLNIFSAKMCSFFPSERPISTIYEIVSHFHALTVDLLSRAQLYDQRENLVKLLVDNLPEISEKIPESTECCLFIQGNEDFIEKLTELGRRIPPNTDLPPLNTFDQVKWRYLFIYEHLENRSVNRYLSRFFHSDFVDYETGYNCFALKASTYKNNIWALTSVVDELNIQRLALAICRLHTYPAYQRWIKKKK